MSAARWDRLAGDLAVAGVEVKIDAQPYSEAVRGRVQYGTTRSARLILADRRHVTIRDAWWRKNPEVWIGYEVALEDAEGMVLRIWPTTKRRGAVVAAVLEASA